MRAVCCSQGPSGRWGVLNQSGVEEGDTHLTSGVTRVPNAKGVWPEVGMGWMDVAVHGTGPGVHGAVN